MTTLDHYKSVAPIAANAAASLWDLGHGVACFEMHTKMNSLSPAAFDMIEETLARAGKDYAALVIANDDQRAFSAGADLSAILASIEAEDFDGLDAYIARGQSLFLGLRYASVPVVAAAHGLALGGGCEFMLHADAVIAHEALMAGLPETKVGLVPGWGGVTQMLLRTGDVRACFETILAGTVFPNASVAKASGLLRTTDTLLADRGALLAAARTRALDLLPDYAPPSPSSIAVAGQKGRAVLMSALPDLASEDLLIAEKLSGILTGTFDGHDPATVTDTEMMAFERRALVELAATPTAHKRIEQTLFKGKRP